MVMVMVMVARVPRCVRKEASVGAIGRANIAEAYGSFTSAYHPLSTMVVL